MEASTSTPPQLKRKRNGRACDSCRERRIKCEWISESCRHCIDFGLTCELKRPDKRRNSSTQVVPRAVPTVTARSTPSRSHSQPTDEPLYYGPANLSQLVYLYAGSTARAATALSLLGRRHQHLREDSSDFFFAGTEGGKPEIHQELSIKAARDLVRQTIADTLMEQLLLDYKSNMGAIYPICDGELARLAMCAVASLSRSVPEIARRTLLTALHGVMDSAEVLRLTRRPTLLSVQISMVMSICEDLHGVTKSDAHALLWGRVGTGIRQAFELGLHRNVSPRILTPEKNAERSRVWGACTIADVWLSLRFGHPHIIDPRDCDSAPQGSPFFNEIVRLSTVLGRIMRTVTTPLGLAGATDVQIILLERELAIPPFDGTEGQILSLLLVALEFTLFRPFWTTPAHLTYRPPPGRWDNMVVQSQRAIAWAATDQGAYYLDVWALIVYPLVVCTIIQLRAYLATRQPLARESILLSQTIFQQWAASDHDRRTRKHTIVDQIEVIVSALEPDNEPEPIDWGWLNTTVPTIDGLGNLEDIDLFNLLNMPM